MQRNQSYDRKKTLEIGKRISYRKEKGKNHKETFWFSRAFFLWLRSPSKADRRSWSCRRWAWQIWSICCRVDREERSSDSSLLWLLEAMRTPLRIDPTLGQWRRKWRSSEPQEGISGCEEETRREIREGRKASKTVEQEALENLFCQGGWKWEGEGGDRLYTVSREGNERVV